MNPGRLVSSRPGGMLLLAAVLGAASPGAAWAQEATESPGVPDPRSDVDVVARATPADVTVGEPFTVELQAIGPDGTHWEFPETAGDNTVELATQAEPDAAGASPEPLPQGVHRYRATAYGLKDVAVPPITVKYRLPDGSSGEITTEPVPITILSLLPKDEDPTLADIRGPAKLDVAWPFWALLGLGIALLAALVSWLLRRRRPDAAPAPAEPPVPPDQRALADLDRLAGQGMTDRGEFRAYYIALTEIAKRYLEERLDAPVLEMTSAEVNSFLREHSHGQVALTAARDLSLAADQVKFARGEGQVQEAGRHLSGVRGMVLAIEERLRPAVPETAQK